MAAPPVRRGGRTPAVVNTSRESEAIYARMGQLMNFASGLTPAALADMPWVPSADLSETDDAYVVKAELPGVNKDQVNIQLQDRELVISGEVPELENGNGSRRQRRRGHRAALGQHPDRDRTEVRGRQAAQDRDHRLSTTSRALPDRPRMP